MKLKLYIFLLFILINCEIYSDVIALKDGKILTGEIYNLTNNNITIYVETNLYSYRISEIEYFIPSLLKDNNNVYLITRLNGKIFRINLIKLTGNYIYYCNVSEEDLHVIKTSNIHDIQLLTSKKINELSQKNNKELDISLNDKIDDFILHIFEINDIKHIEKDELLSILKSYVISISDNDYYEKFWSKLEKIISKDTENLIFDLIDQYLSKEKYLRLVLNKKLSYENNDITPEYINDEIKMLRIDFYYRAKKIILNIETY